MAWQKQIPERKKKENPGYAIKQTKKILKKSEKTALKESSNEALNIMDESFEQTYGLSFEESLIFNFTPVKIGGKLKNIIFGKQWKKLKLTMNTLWLTGLWW